MPGVPPTDLLCVCKNCKNEFVLTVGEQRFFPEHGLSLPKRCPTCREERKRAQGTFGVQVVSVDSACGVVLCKRCSRPASRRLSLKLKEALCEACESKNEFLPRTSEDDLLFYEDWEAHFNQQGASDCG